MASRSVNKVILLGHLGRDAETKFTPTGAAVTNFSVATSHRWKDQKTNEWKENTTWTNIVLWGQEKLAQYLLKGTQVFVEGRIETRSYDNKQQQKVYVTEVIANEVILCGGKSNGDDGYHDQRPQAARPRSSEASSQSNMDDGFGGITDDDVPF